MKADPWFSRDKQQSLAVSTSICMPWKGSWDQAAYFLEIKRSPFTIIACAWRGAWGQVHTCTTFYELQYHDSPVSTHRVQHPVDQHLVLETCCAPHDPVPSPFLVLGQFPLGKNSPCSHVEYHLYHACIQCMDEGGVNMSTLCVPVHVIDTHFRGTHCTVEPLYGHLRTIKFVLYREASGHWLQRSLTTLLTSIYIACAS